MRRRNMRSRSDQPYSVHIKTAPRERPGRWMSLRYSDSHQKFRMSLAQWRYEVITKLAYLVIEPCIPTLCFTTGQSSHSYIKSYASSLECLELRVWPFRCRYRRLDVCTRHCTSGDSPGVASANHVRRAYWVCQFDRHWRPPRHRSPGTINL